MIYESIPIVSFTDLNGNTYGIRDMREYPEYTPMSMLKVKSGEFLDEIASRKEVYGEDSEAEVYKLFEANIISLVESGYDLGKIGKITVPL